MYKPRNYESTQEFGTFEPLQLGGHVCKICKVTETTSRNGKPMAVIWLDIAEGEQKGYYAKMWQSGDRNKEKWPCAVYQLEEDSNGNTNMGYKTFLEAVKRSNPGFDENRLWADNGNDYLKNKLIGGVFGREQYENNRGELRFSTKCVYFRDVETIRKGVEVPPDKLLEGAKPPVCDPLSDYEPIVTDDDDMPF